ncbi:hypothetical protein NY607_13035 [Lysinibacillus sp. A4]|uniref:hypothetical protein n=1 Tax=Lysinibacillus sp. A4 TaxID=2976269 RepID=UPI002175BBFF|nr:hypothetical protein [Lysinibacillus sp. A4]MCS5502053.1 hypothetical protein [Lysinibacillus sp. A4]
MKKGKIVKFSAATMVALSAITPVAAFANETETTAPGFYTGSTFVPVADFAKLSKTAKKAFLAENIKDNALVLVQNGKVYDMTKEEIQNAPASEVEGLGKTVEEYTAETGKKLTPNGIVDNEAGLTVSSVSAIETTYVEVTFPATTDEVKGATVEVKDSKGNVIETKATDIAKGATFAQFDFVKSITADDQKGVWTVNGVEYSFVAKEQLDKIITTAGGTNNVAFRDALDAAAIKNVDNAFLADYKTVITTPATAPKTLVDVQKIVDDVNAKKADSDAVVKPVLDAKNQIDLLKALEANFDRVNRDWIESYITADGTVNPGIEITVANTPNTVHPTAAAAVTPVTAEAIQAAIDAVNLVNIGTADLAVTGANLKASEQAKVTDLIQAYQKDDVAPAKTKAIAIKASQVKEAALKVKEAGTQNAVYTALVNLANVDSDNLKISELNSKLTSFYYDKQDTNNASLDKTTANVKTHVVVAADTAALSAAMGDVVTATGKVVGSDTAANLAELKAALQKVADYTSHKTGTSKFDVSIVKEANLVKYATAFDTAAKITAASTVADLVAKITPVNSAQGLDAALDTINDTKSTAVQVVSALTDIAVGTTLTTGTTDADFINLSPQAKLEVAEFVIEARPASGYPDLDAVLTAADGTGALETAISDHATQVAKFNAIADLASATTSATKGELDKYAYDAYMALTPSQKIAVAEEINKLVHVDKDGKETSYDFSGADAVKTLKAANDIIDAAIAKITAQ